MRLVDVKVGNQVIIGSSFTLAKDCETVAKVSKMLVITDKGRRFSLATGIHLDSKISKCYRMKICEVR